MLITFDLSKDESNCAKHGVSLREAVLIEWDTAMIWRDTRKNYGEARMAAIGYIDTRLYYVVYVDRGDTRRVISLRKANSREVRRYAET